MIDLSQKNVVKISKETNFLKDNIEKVMRLIDLLEFIFLSKWGDKLTLKGGTAINLFYRKLPRLSVDIDLDYIGESKNQMEKDKEEILNFLSVFLYQKGYSLSSQSKRYFALDSLTFQYINNAGNRDNIKIDINYLDRNHVLPIQKKNIDLSFFHSEVEINVLDVCELYGSKIAALLDRCKPRDIYDVYGMIKGNIIIDNEILKKCIIFYNCISGNGRLENSSFDILDSVSNSDINKQLRPMLDKNDHFSKDDAINTIKEFLNKIIVLTKNEKEFIKKFNAREYQPHLLFDGDELNNIKLHPMAEWRCKKEN